MDRNEWDVADPPDAGSVFTVHRLGLLRLAVLLIGDRATAEDVVQDAFAGLHSRWAELHDVASALAYVRGSVVNGCRMVLRRRSLMRRIGILGDPPIWSAESAALVREDHREVIEALQRLALRRGRFWSCSTTSTCPTRRSRRSWASASPPSGPPPPVRSARSANCSRRAHDHRGPAA